MKPSGIEWLGQMPAHWQTKRLKDVSMPLDGIQMGPFGGMSVGSGNSGEVFPEILAKSSS